MIATSGRGTVIAASDRGTVVAVAYRGTVVAVTYRGTVVAVAVTWSGSRTSSGTMMAVTCRRSRVVEVVTGVETGTPVIMASTETHIHCGAMHEHPATSITAVDGERPATGSPYERTVEIGACHKAVELPGTEHEAQVAVAHLPPGSEHIGAVVDVEQVVEVDFIHSLILLVGQTKFICHFVAEKQRLVASGIVCHCVGRDGYRHHHCHKHHLLHNCNILMVIIRCFLCAKVAQTECRVKHACYAEVQPTFALLCAKVVQTECRVKHACYAEVQPTFALLCAKVAQTECL